jgi:hypothetical protein
MSAPFHAETRTSEPTLTPERWFLSACYRKTEFRGAWCDVSGKIVEVRHKMMFREQFMPFRVVHGRNRK